MTEEQYRELDYCICRYNSYFYNRPHVDRGLCWSVFFVLCVAMMVKSR